MIHQHTYFTIITELELFIIICSKFTKLAPIVESAGLSNSFTIYFLILEGIVSNANEKIDAHIKSIRKILKEFQEYKLITVRGKGYYLRIP